MAKLYIFFDYPCYMSRFGFILFSVLILTACHHKVSEVENEAVEVGIDLSSAVKDVPLSSFIDSISTMRLELSDSLFFGGIKDIMFAHNSIYVVDSKQHVVFRFSYEGEYTNSIGSIGGGPGEYTTLSSFFIGDSCVYIVDQPTRQIYQYSPEGAFIGKIVYSFGQIYQDIMKLPGDLFLCHEYVPEPDVVERGVWILNDKGKRVETILKKEGSFPSLYSDFSTLKANANGIIHLYDPLLAECYIYNPFTKELKMTYRFVPDIKQLCDFDGKSLAYAIREKYASCFSLIEAEHYIFMLWIISNGDLPDSAYVLYEKQSGEMDVFKQLKLDIPDVFSMGRFVSSNVPNTLVSYYMDEELLEFYPEEYKRYNMSENVLLVKMFSFK